MQISLARKQIADALKMVTVEGVPRLNAMPYVPDKTPTLPAAYVQPTDGDFGTTYAGPDNDGAAEARFVVVLLVSRTDDVTSQQRLDALMPACREALEDDDVVDGADVLVPSWSDYGWHTAADGTTALGVRLNVVVTGPGDW